MSWDFETEPEFQVKLDWMNAFVREEVEPLDDLFPHDIYPRPMKPVVREIIRPLQQQVQRPGAVGVPPRSRARRAPATGS